MFVNFAWMRDRSLRLWTMPMWCQSIRTMPLQYPSHHRHLRRVLRPLLQQIAKKLLCHYPSRNRQNRCQTKTQTQRPHWRTTNVWCHTAPKSKPSTNSTPNRFMNLSAADSPSFQPKIVLNRLTSAQINEFQPKQPPLASKRKTKTVGRVADLRMAQMTLPPLIGTGNKDCAIHARRCLFVSKLDPAHTTKEILSHFISKLSTTENDVKVYNISKSDALYSSFRIWCSDDVFRRAMNAAMWPPGTIIR